MRSVPLSVASEKADITGPGMTRAVCDTQRGCGHTHTRDPSARTHAHTHLHASPVKRAAKRQDVAHKAHGFRAEVA